MISLAIAGALHILAAVLWVGAALTLHLFVRPALVSLAPGPRLATMNRIFAGLFPAVALAICVLYASGLWLVKARYGGFADAPPPVHIMAALGTIMTAIFIVIWFGPWKRMKAALLLTDLAGAARALGLIRRLVLINLLLGCLVVALAGGGTHLFY